MVQVTGLPGSGKTTAIESFLGTTEELVRYLDLNMFSGPTKEEEFASALLSVKENTIGESACGVTIPMGFTVRLDIPLEEVYQNLLLRDKTVDPDYLSLIRQAMIHPDVVVSNQHDLVGLLHQLF